MRAETRRVSFETRGNPEFGLWFAHASIPVVDDEGTLSSTRVRHQADPCAGRYGCEHRGLCRLAPRLAHELGYWCTPVAAHQITAFRHSVGGLPRRVTGAGAVGALGNAANDDWEFGSRYFSEAASASLQGTG